MEQFNVYKDIQARTGGEIYIGVVGPVRTGKSTFIRRFMEQIMIPNMDEKDRGMATDEVPVSGKGKMITTVEPKFIPKSAVSLRLDGDISVKMRLIDCVGFMVEGATGHMEDEKERMVKTPWFDEEIPFSRAAHIGTEKVIRDHSTIGIVMTCDGSFGELDRQAFEDPEQQTVAELKKIGKPFIIVVNSAKPYSDSTSQLCTQLSDKYGVAAIAMNCDQLCKEDIQRLMETLLMEFPVCQINFYTPKWLDILPPKHPLKAAVLDSVGGYLAKISVIRDVRQWQELLKNDYMDKFFIEEINMSTGIVKITLSFAMKYYYELLSSTLGCPIQGEYELFKVMKELVAKKQEFDKVAEAISQVHQKGYGVVTAGKEEIQIMEPELVKHGNKFGVNIRASAPSIHMISAGIETEIAPIVGTQQQAQDLVDYIRLAQSGSGEAIWDTLIFGKSIGELVEEGMKGKIAKLNDECQLKLQETLRKIINDSRGNIIFVII
ncbi:stage IV sporulation protein A [Catenibacillus scindens]|uniref:Stage IV sporulation protein A n=1 Tax=Catenibacillus scindens TaxID=673271 RepID=A0A7W8H868_9FIRM|nr:stage IV sporulation protein A [Catenibacillus scindens]MBB5263599.1 stage IV sporulation protein A [Catenibacillus scindens]